MIYIIERTSCYNDKAPCEEAVKRSFERWYTPSCSEEEFNKRFSAKQGLWRSKGKNHTLTEEGVTRIEREEELWSIEINSLDELQKLSEKYGELIIKAPDYGLKAPSIEIYDDYRE